MKIKFKSTFTERLERQVRYIAIDSPSRARKFKNELLKQVKKIPKNPYIHRKSIYFDENNIRDLIFKSYCIVYKINDSDKTIEVFGLAKYQENPTD